MAGPRSVSQPVQLYRQPLREHPWPSIAGPECAQTLRALAEETRLRIVGLLIGEPLDVSEISQRLSVSTYNISKHLRILREAGLLEVQKNGRRHLYGLSGPIRERAAETGVVDLGCCSFQFTAAALENRKSSGRYRPKHAARRVARLLGEAREGE